MCGFIDLFSTMYGKDRDLFNFKVQQLRVKFGKVIFYLGYNC